MPSRTRRVPLPAALAAVTVAAVGGLVTPASSVSAAGGATPAGGEVYRVPPGGVYTLHGRGFGHGHGMSQWGAYGAAKVDNLSANQILHFYYPHTTLATRPTSQLVRILLTAAGAPAVGYVAVAPAPGLTVTAAGGTPTVLPTASPAAKPITGWRLKQAGATLTLQGAWGSGWHTVTRQLAAPVTISDTASVVPVVEPAGANTTKTVRYRGVIEAEIPAGDVEAVNLVNLEQYLRAVVPSEMPASWSMPALAAQAVAARTYAWRGIAHPKTSWFDLFGDTRDQGYGGVGSEDPRTDAAIDATAGEVAVDSSGAPILAQYSSADGGWTVSGGVSYLPARADPYDGAVPNTAHAWTTTLSAGSIASAFPAVGTVSSLVITGRDGHGVWGGRVTGITVKGTAASVSMTGTAFQLAFGLRSPWFRPTPAPGPPRHLVAQSSRRVVTVTWKPPAAIKGAAAVTGYRVSLAPGGTTVKVDASTLSASYRKAPVGTDTVTVTALSTAGRGPGAAATVVVKAGH